MKSAIAAALAKRPKERYFGDEQVHSPVGFCRGPWRIEMPDDSGLTTRADVAFAVDAKFRVVHVDRFGRRTEHVMKQTLEDYGRREAPPKPIVFDFDGSRRARPPIASGAGGGSRRRLGSRSRR